MRFSQSRVFREHLNQKKGLLYIDFVQQSLLLHWMYIFYMEASSLTCRKASEGNFLFQRLVEAPNAAEDEDDGSHPFHCPFRDALAHDDADDDAKAVSDDHAHQSTAPYGKDGLELSSQGDRGKLGLVPHFRHEESYRYGPERTGIARFLIAIGDLVAPDRPEPKDDEGDAGGDMDG